MWLGFSNEFWITTAVAILGIAISVVFAFRRVRNRIVLTITQSASLIAEVARDIPNIKVLYAGNEIAGDLVWVTGVIANASAQDVGRSTVAKYPTLLLSSNAEWREFSLGKTDDGLEAEANIIDSVNTTVEWNILRPYEAIPFSALIATPDRSFVDDLRQGRGLRITARIENTDCSFEGQISPNASASAARTLALNAAALATIAIAFYAALVLHFFDFQTTALTDPRKPGQFYDQVKADYDHNRVMMQNIYNPQDSKWLSLDDAVKMKLTPTKDPSIGALIFKVFAGVIATSALVLAISYGAALRRKYIQSRYLSTTI